MDVPVCQHNENWNTCVKCRPNLSSPSRCCVDDGKDCRNEYCLKAGCHTAEKPVQEMGRVTAEVTREQMEALVKSGAKIILPAAPEKDENEIIHEGLERLYGSVGEEWEKRWEAEIPLMQVSTHVDPRHLDENKVKAFISKLLQEEREKMQFAQLMKCGEHVKEAKLAERQRIEEVVSSYVEAVENPTEAEAGFQNALALVLKIIRGEV